LTNKDKAKSICGFVISVISDNYGLPLKRQPQSYGAVPQKRVRTCMITSRL